jgi:hypothetical protein
VSNAKIRIDIIWHFARFILMAALHFAMKLMGILSPETCRKRKNQELG